MPSWGIHLKLAKKLNKELNINQDLFIFGNLIPDVDKNTKYSRMQSHYYTGIKYPECPSENMIDLTAFLKDYKKYLNNPMILGYYCHLLTDQFYNKYIYTNKYIKNKNNEIIGIKQKNGNIINIDNKDHITQMYKHKDLELYAKHIINEENVIYPKDITLINQNIIYLKDNFYTKEDVINRINYLNNGEFHKFNKLELNELANKDNYLLFTKKELDDLLNDCFKYIIDIIKTKERENGKEN